MEHLNELSLEDLQQALEEVDGKKPTMRLLAAIAYKNGVTQTELAEWYDVERRTIYSWLKRLESESLAQAVTDARRSGRPRKLNDEQRERFEQALQEPPTAVGYDASAWSPELAQRYLDETYNVDYSIPSCRRLMKEAGLRYEPARRTATTSSGGDQTPDGRSGGSGKWTPS
ncbi:transposase [Halostagnicola larsenii XH-48]|uniref:Transposase n=1 Tax=Halostagnicola larsenii XH-48 TaxID=797299 RepID=W0JMB8_9EURY|nr:transposase [Halostagnicola larsenii XH-48]